MLFKPKKLNNKGFTIIEVLIVLAIAALIILIVFLAVPALQRNARNSSRRNDVAKLLGVVTEYVSNNNGALPNDANCAGASMQLTGTNNTAVEGAYYCRTAATQVDVTNQANPGTTDQLWLRIGFTCNAAGNAATVGNARAVSALYRLEPNVVQCQAT